MERGYFGHRNEFGSDRCGQLYPLSSPSPSSSSESDHRANVLMTGNQIKVARAGPRCEPMPRERSNKQEIFCITSSEPIGVERLLSSSITLNKHILGSLSPLCAGV